jgi:prepilin-type N-terminal cleavage/methylation domain-containing protein
MPRRRAVRRGFTLWEVSMVLFIMSIAAILVAPALSRFGTEQPEGTADKVLALLHDARRVAIDIGGVVVLRIDPKNLHYRADSTGTNGTGLVAEGTLDLAATQTVATDRPRLQFVFKSTGAAFADSVVVNGGDKPLVVRVDPWSGVASADAR